MDSGRCRVCGRAFTAGEVTGMGILRPRLAAAGGPVVEFPCPGCRTVLRLVPHGNGRYAPPGAAPPPVPNEDERRVPWLRGDRQLGRGPEVVPAERPQARPPPVPVEPPTPPPDSRAAPGGNRGPSRRPDAGEGPLHAAEALEILGIKAGATEAEIELAYRERALQCHPDKVAHLDAEFIALAERKFRRLKAARECLLGPEPTR